MNFLKITVSIFHFHQCLSVILHSISKCVCNRAATVYKDKHAGRCIRQILICKVKEKQTQRRRYTNIITAYFQHNNEKCKKEIVLTFAYLNSNYCLLHVDGHVAEFTQTSMTLLLSIAKIPHFHSVPIPIQKEKNTDIQPSPEHKVLESNHFLFIN